MPASPNYYLTWKDDYELLMWKNEQLFDSIYMQSDQAARSPCRRLYH